MLFCSIVATISRFLRDCLSDRVLLFGMFFMRERTNEKLSVDELLRMIVEEGTDRPQMILCKSNGLSESNVTVSVSLKSNSDTSRTFFFSFIERMQYSTST